MNNKKTEKKNEIQKNFPAFSDNSQNDQNRIHLNFNCSTALPAWYHAWLFWQNADNSLIRTDVAVIEPEIRRL